MKPVTYFEKDAFSINEGGGPVNIHVSRNRYGYKFFIYLYLFGLRFHYMR